MNIIIPIGGIGKRFTDNGYKDPKPLIKIFEKHMIEYVLTNLVTTKDDKIFIIYNSNLDKYNFLNIISTFYPHIKLITINRETCGAAETLMLGIEQIIKNYSHDKKCLIMDCDTFYTQDIVGLFRDIEDNAVFYTIKESEPPIYSYIELSGKQIVNIAEKKKISNNANTGAYAFSDINILYDYCKKVIENNVRFNGEAYTSCVISLMIKDGLIFEGIELDNNYVFSLGTPHDVEEYIKKTKAFLFDLDGTLVITDDVYFDVWKDILKNYNLDLTEELFNHYIKGNSDKYVINKLLLKNHITLENISKQKDEGFIKNIQKIKIISGAREMLINIKKKGHKCCIVTNCNKNVAQEIIKIINVEQYIDFIISSNDCHKHKPDPEPYSIAITKYGIDKNNTYIFEDSKTGILSALSIRPNVVIGITTNYSSAELITNGVDMAINDYENFNFDALYEFINADSLYIKKMIADKMHINISDIQINDTKLKGGFIANVIEFKIKHHDMVYILKYENRNISALSTMAQHLQLYEREYYFYHNISKYINVKIPLYIDLLKDKDNKNIGIILESLNRDKFKINLNLNKTNIDISLKIVARMALMHSKFWNKNIKNMFPGLYLPTDSIFCPFMYNFITEKIDIFKKKWSTVLSNEQITHCDTIYKNFNDIQRRLATNNLTFIHGDLKSPNIFYDQSDNSEPYFLDWQHCAIGKGVQDLVFFIIESFDITHIKTLFSLFKNYYYMKLIEYGITGYSYDEYENDIKDALSYIPFFTAIWFGSTPDDELIDKNWCYFFIQKVFYLSK